MNSSLIRQQNAALLRLYESTRDNDVNNVRAAVLHLGGYVTDINLGNGGKTTIQEALHLAINANRKDSHLCTIEVLLHYAELAVHVNSQDEQGNTSLHRAAATNNPKTIELILKSGADPNLKNKKGEIPLFRAVEMKNIENVRLLLKYNSDANSVNNSGYTLFFLATKLVSQNEDDEFRLFEALLEGGADVNALDGHGNTPLHYLVCKNNPRIVKLLLGYEPDPGVKDKEGRTPLLVSILSSNYEILQLLLSYYGVNDTSHHGCSALHLAVFHLVDLNTIKCIVKSGADPNALNLTGQTPLMILLKKKHFSSTNAILRYLLNWSDINMVDLTGNNVLDYCHKNEKGLKICLQHIAKLIVLGIKVSQDIERYIKNQASYNCYFIMCLKELTEAKSTRFKDNCFTFLDLLVDDKRNIKNYPDCEKLIDDFVKNGDKYPIYECSMENNLKKVIIRRNLLEKSTENWPFFTPDHSIVRDIFELMPTEDLLKLSE